MTKVVITVQEKGGKPTVTWIMTEGDKLPDDIWTDLNIGILNAFDK